MFHDYKISETRFAGPTMFARADTTHFNQHGVPVCKERATSIRYLAAEAERRGSLNDTAGKAPRWTPEQLKGIDKERLDWMLSNRDGHTPQFEETAVGQRLPRRVIGPHTLVSFATEYRAFVFNVWGSFRWVAPACVKDPWVNQDPGWVPGFGFDELGAARREDTWMPPRLPRSACRAPTDTARPWAPGSPITSRTGRVMTGSFATRKPTFAVLPAERGQGIKGA